MKVRLMVTCLCDAFYGEVGIATTKVLEHFGCEVEFLPEQTCCGQPPFNAGDWEAAKPIVERCLNTFELDQKKPIPVVTPSSSCAAMLREGAHQLLGRGSNDVYELCEFLVKKLDVSEVGGSVDPVKVALHRACHGRALGLTDEQERLLSSVSGVTLVPVEAPEQCCGFGGAFSVTHGETSSGIGVRKLDAVADSGADLLVAGDMGCLMHLKGLMGKEGKQVRTAHIAELLAEAVSNG